MADEHKYEDLERDALFTILSETERLANVGGWEWDTVKDVWTFSNNWLRIHGCSKRHLATFELLPIAHPDDRQDIQQAFERAVNEGVKYEIEHRIIRQDTGEERYVRAVGKPKLNSDGNTVKLYGSVQDITENKMTEQSLKESEKRLKISIESGGVGLWELNLIDLTAWRSLTHDRIFGYESPLSEWTYEMFLDHVVEEDRPMVEEEFGKAMKNKELWDFNCRINRKDGVSRWIHAKGKPEIDENQNPIKMYGTIQDITESKKAEEALLQKHEMLKRTEAIAHVGSWEWDIPSDRVQWSDELFRIFGRDPSSGAPSYAEHPEIYVTEDMQRLHEAVKACVNQGKPYEIELRAIRTDGEIRHCIGRGRAQRDGSGKVFRLVGSHQDITERKQTEERMRASEEMMRSSQSVAHICSYSTNLNVNEIEKSSWVCSPEFYNIFGIDKTYPHTIEGWANFIHPDYREEVFDYHESVVKEKKSFSLEYKIIRHNDGAERWVHGTGELEYDEKGTPVRMHGAIQDITERRRSEMEKEKLQSQLVQAQKMESIGHLAGGVAHDFNNMLGVILGHTEMALEKTDPASPLYANLHSVHQAGERSADLTRQLLAFARKQTIAPKVIDINDIVEGMLNMLRRLIGEDINLLWKPGINLQPVKVDPAQIDQILANLCVNARDAIDGVGMVAIITDAKTFSEDYCHDQLGSPPGEYILLEVSDDGCGIDKKTLDHIFEPFFTTKEQGKGTGLGLASIYGIVKQNNGFINVYSEPDHGTTFKIYLPVYTAKSAEVAEKAHDLPAEQGSETILLVEDESAILTMTTTMLARLGYNVVAAATPGEAIRLAQEYQGEIDLLMTDVVMPEMNGQELAKNLLSHYPDLKHLFMSGYTANVIAHHGVLVEGVHFIQKPFSKKDLGGKVREALEG